MAPGGPPEPIADGFAFALSPDDTRVAVSQRIHDGAFECSDLTSSGNDLPSSGSIVVLDLVAGTEESWRVPTRDEVEPDAQSTVYTGKLAWTPDGARLFFGDCWEGCMLRALDVDGPAARLHESPIYPGNGAAFDVVGDRLIGVEWCCPLDDWQEERIVSYDLATCALERLDFMDQMSCAADPLLDFGDEDLAEHVPDGGFIVADLVGLDARTLLFLRAEQAGGGLWRWDGTGTPELLHAEGITAAALG